MLINLKKNVFVGVSISLENGIEVAQIDFRQKRLLKYRRKSIGFDKIRNEIADLDLFKETLTEMLLELQIPKGADIILSLPTTLFGIKEYPAALSYEETGNAILEELAELPEVQDIDPCLSHVKLPNSSIQFNRMAYCVASRAMLVEIAMIIKSIGYNVAKIVPSVNATLNSLVYCNKIDVASDISWVLLLVDGGSCTVLLMQGKTYIDCYTEKIAIGDVLGEDENIKTIIDATKPILKNLPSKYLYVVSKTDIISAQSLAKKLVYSAPIVHLEANNKSNESIIEFSQDILDESVRAASLDVIGAAVESESQEFSAEDLNLFNKNLGEVFLAEQPPVIKFGNKTLVLSLENMVNWTVIFALLIIISTAVTSFILNNQNKVIQSQLTNIEAQIQEAQEYLRNHDISAEKFDEGYEIRLGLTHNKIIYSYFTIIGTEIPTKLWLTSLYLGDYISIEGQADNIESVYAFYRNIKDYNQSSDIKLQKLGLASNSKISLPDLQQTENKEFMLTSMNADCYQFKISNVNQTENASADNSNKNENDNNNEKKTTAPKMELEPVD